MTSGATDLDDTWWLWILVTPLYGGLIAVIGGGLVLFGATQAGVSLGTVAPLLVGFALVGSALALFFPLALYRDACHLRDAGADWQPNPRRWAALGVASVLTGHLLAIPLSAYYLRRR